MSKIRINMEKAREIRRNQIRQERERLFAQYDKEMLLALESGDDKARARIARIKQRLRDAPADPAIQKATTLEELKQVNPLAAVDQ